MSGIYGYPTDPAQTTGTVGTSAGEGGTVITEDAVAVKALNNAMRGMVGDLGNFRNDISAAATSTGSSNAYVLATGSEISALADGMRLTWLPNHTNTGAATLNVDSQGAKKLLFDSAALAADEIKAGQPVDCVYDASADSAAGAWLVLNPKGASLAQLALVEARAAQEVTFKNATINGDFQVWERGTSFTASGYTADRWELTEGSGAACTISRQAFTLGQTDVPGEPEYFLRWERGTAGSAESTLGQPIENVRTFAGQSVTVSFYAKAAAATELKVDLVQHFGTGGSPSSDVSTAVVAAQALTTSWQRFDFQVSVPSISGKTLGTTINNYLLLQFTREHDDTNPTTTVDIADVQVEAGGAPTDFERLPEAVQEWRCQRYCRLIPRGTNGTVSSATIALVGFPLDPPMRTIPSATLVNGTNAIFAPGGSGLDTVTSIGAIRGNGEGVTVELNSSGLTGNQGFVIDVADFALLSAEL